MLVCAANAEEPIHSAPLFDQIPAGRYRFANVEVDFHAAELRRAGLRIKIQDQPLHVLAVLLSRRGEVVSRDELRKMLWPADTFVDFDHSLNSAVKRLRDVLHDDPDNPRLIETIRRHGYRFIAPVSEIAPAEPDSLAVIHHPAETPTSRQDSAPGRTRERESNGRVSGYIWVTAAMILLLMAITLVGMHAWGTRARSRPHPPKTILAVLPFRDLSENSTGRSVAAGLTQEVITQLGKADPEGLALVDRISSEQTLLPGASASTTATKPESDYLLEGSIRVQATGARIAVQLIRVKDRQILWTDAYDEPLIDVLQIQREVAQVVTHDVCERLNLRASATN